MTDDPLHTGRCLCGAVAYEIRGALAPAHACHCGQCRRQSGHYVVAVDATPQDFRFTEDRGLRWYASSDRARRGFCAECGSALVWTNGDVMSVTAGSLDAPAAVRLERHIFYDEKPDFYEVADGLSKFAQGDDRIEGAR